MRCLYYPKFIKKKHESIRHYLVKDGYIEIEADCEEYAVYSSLKEWIGWIEQACELLVIKWNEITPSSFVLPPRLKTNKIKINGNDRWESFADSKIHIDAEKAVRLFQGTNIYDGKYIFVRELIQNAVDASLIQLYKEVMELDEFSGKKITTEDILSAIKKDIDIKNYSIEGNIYERGDDEGEKRVFFELRDYGTGIEEKDIEAIVGMKGKRKELRNLIADIPEFFRPSGAFGIGIQSVFQVASELIYITKTDEESTKKITIKAPSQGGTVYVEDYKKSFKRGTKVIVQMDPSKFTRDDFSVGNFIYDNTPINKLVIQWLSLSIRNVYSSSIYSNQEKAYSDDYFDINIYEHENYNKKDNIVVKRESFVPMMAEAYSEPHLLIDNNRLIYKYYDLEKNCVFEVTANMGRKDDFVLSGKQNNSYIGEGILYRNVSVEQGVRALGFLNNWQSNWFDYRVNLFSDSAADVLTLGRNSVTDSYRGKISNIIKYEMALFFKLVIDKSISTNNLHNYLIATAYMGAQVYGYKSDDVYEKNKAVLDKLKLKGFYDVKGKSVDVDLLMAINEKILFLYEVDKDDEKDIPKSVWANNDECKILDSESKLFLCEPGTRLSPLLLFNVDNSYFAKYKGKKYFCFEASYYQKAKIERKKEYKRSRFLRYKSFLSVILGDAGFVLPVEHYSNIETPIIIDGIEYVEMIEQYYSHVKYIDVPDLADLEE